MRLLGCRSARRILLLSAVALLAAQNALCADCSISKPFAVVHQQSLSGELRDSMGGSLAGVRLALISDKSIVRYVTTDPAGHYDFGNVFEGSYRVRVKDSAFCAPDVTCEGSVCKIG